MTSIRENANLRFSLRSGYDALRIFVAVVLLVAAGLKFHQLVTEPILGKGFLDSRWLLIATVEFELFFGLWLMANILPKPTWAAALACFGLFTCISLYKALSGYATCGCFGSVQVNPWYTTTFDLAIVLSLLCFRPRGQKAIVFPPSPFRLPPSVAAVLSLWLVLGLPAAYAMGSYTDTTLSDIGDIIGNGKIVVLEPEKWIGKQFPLLDHIDIGDKLKEGKWLVVLYHHDCSECQEAIPKYKKLAQQSATDPSAPRVALIEVPPYGDRNELQLSSDAQLTLGQLTEEKEWFVATPAQIVLKAGVVVNTKGGSND